jgi:para-aminobenzoate synthetase / 4-amino-4-deoxychorismate lyase
VPNWVRLPEYVHTLIAERAGSVLLETSRFDRSNSHSFVFLDPIGIITTNELDEIPLAFSRIEEALSHGHYVAGYLSYECGHHFEPRVWGTAASDELPLMWFGIYEDPLVFDHAQGDFKDGAVAPPAKTEAKQAAPQVSNPLNLDIGQEDYSAAIRKIKEHIAAGETYQVNFTNAVSFDTQAQPSGLFESLLHHQSIAYGAWVNIAGQHILSFSPELFFRTEGREIVTRPMKGTMQRGLDLAEDEQAAEKLLRDEKNRSEHVMIVDLIRNDLGRICETGSVRVEDLFSVERYETLLQMTSTISGTLRKEVRYYDIFKSMFPSGSVTGAPKIRTMQIIDELERRPRGIYTGSIGFLSPHGSSAFNVAIRTVVLQGAHARMGVGGGIVADSDPAEEYKECLLKAAFLSRAPQDFQLFETLLWDKNFDLLSFHMDRMESSATYFNFAFNRPAALSRLDDLSNSFVPGKRYRIRLLVDLGGNLVVESSELLEQRPMGYVKISPHHTLSTDVFLRHKTTMRKMYDREHAEARADGFDDVLFINEKNEVTEGAISNIFIQRTGKLFTPPLSCGVLPGVFRRHLLATNPATEEKVLRLSDVETADAVFLSNSIRGLYLVNVST